MCLGRSITHDADTRRNMTTRHPRHLVPTLLVVALVAFGLVATSSTPTRGRRAAPPVSTAPAATTAPGPVVPSPTPPIADDRLVVGLEPGASSADASAIAQDAGVGGAEVVDDHTIVVDQPAGGIAAPQATRLRDDHRVKYVEPNYRISGAFVPNDPALPSLGGLRNAQPGGIRAEAAWDTTLGSRGVVVGVLGQRDRRHPPRPRREPLDQPARHRRLRVRHPRLQRVHEAVHHRGPVRARHPRLGDPRRGREQRGRDHRCGAPGLADVADDARPERQRFYRRRRCARSTGR